MTASAALIAWLGNKGGTGKTTLAINSAMGLSRLAPTAVLDLDPQRSSWQWSRIAEADALAAHVYDGHNNVAATVADLRQRYHYLIIDCPPSVEAAQTREILRLADQVLVPVQPSPMDLWATVSVVDAVDAARREHPRLQARIVLNQLEARTVLSRDIRQVIDEVGMAVLAGDVRRRAVYRNAMAEGKTVFDMGSEGREAVEEIERLIEEVIA